MLGSRDLVAAVLEDPRTSPLPPNEKALFAFLEKVNADSTAIGQGDVDATKAAGWSDEAIYDAITVCALFRFYNTWIDATGVHDMPSAAYEATGHRLATQGYTRPKS
ncbi:MAG TPA: peroxidase [Planctomycetota bacterium]|nr:peroxidase [Planctomycetota bacterium]